MMPHIFRKKLNMTMIIAGLVCSLWGCTRPGEKAGEKTTEAVTYTETTMTEAVVEENVPATTEEQHDIKKLTVTATGDWALGPIQTHGYAGSFHEYYDNYGEGYFIQNFKELFEEDDFTLINLECALTNEPFYPEANPDKEFFIVGKLEYSGIMASSGVEGCSLGNNHSKDVGTTGLADTEAACDSVGVKWAVDDSTAIYETDDGYTIGFVSSLLTGPVERENYIRNGIEEFKEKDVDLIIACCHWGEEKQYYPTDYQQRLAHEFVDMGADLIVGNHPHVVQGIEYYNGKVICYSLGNFCFGASHHPYDMETMVFQQTFTYVDGELKPALEAHIIPARVSSDRGNNDFQPVYLEDEEKSDFIERVNTYSEPYSPVSFDSEGNMRIGYGDEGFYNPVTGDVMSDDGSNVSEDGTVIMEDEETESDESLDEAGGADETDSSDEADETVETESTD